MRRTLFLALAAATASAQFAEFAVTDDGRLFFTSPLAISGDDMRAKLYSATSGGISLVASGGGSNALGPDIVAPFTSGDGSITGYARHYPNCNPRCSFIVLPRTFFTIQGRADFSNVAFDRLQVSRSGRFLLASTYDYFLRLIELRSGETRYFPQFLVSVGKYGVSNSGAVLMRDSRVDGTLLFAAHGEEPRPIPGTEGAYSANLSPDGGRIAYERGAEDGFELVLTDPQGSAHQLVAKSPNRDSFQPSFANDGTLLYLSPAGLPCLLRPGGESSTFKSILAGVTQAVLSGNGEIMWIVTANGSLVRVRTADAGIDEFIPETPNIAPLSFSAVPGSVIRVFGSGLTARTQFVLAGTPLPYAELSRERAALQIPWEFPTGQGEQRLVIRTPGNPFYLNGRFFSIAQPAVNFERAGASSSSALQAAHQDFRGIVSSSDPARPGETIHVFARNLGPVDQVVATGGPSPISPPARITSPLACTLYANAGSDPSPRTEPAVIPFAGLSGGSIGIYQIDVTIPADWNYPEASLRCTIDFRADVDRIAIAAIP